MPAFSDPAATPQQWPFFRRLRQISTLLIRGSASDILALDTTQRMQQAVPALEIVEVPNRGHTPSLEEPVVQHAIAAFLAALPNQLSTSSRLRRAVSGWLFRASARRAGVIQE